MSTRIKGCICFFGLVKNVTDDNLKAYRKHVFKQLYSQSSELGAVLDLDAFLHTFDARTFSSGVSNESNTPIDQDASIALLKSLPCDFKKIEITDHEHADSFADFQPTSYYLRHGDPWPQNPRQSLIYYLRQLYSLRRVTSLMKESATTYSFVVYIRPDLHFIDDLDPSILRKCINAEKPTIAVPRWHAWSGYNDRFAIGTYDAMCLYGSRVDRIRQYAALRRPHAETFLKHVLVSNNVIVIPLSVRFYRWRANNEPAETLKFLSTSYMK